MAIEADPAYVEHWGAFYAHAWERVLVISTYHGVLAPLTVAKILAVTSPRMPWGRNLGIADTIVGTWARWPSRAREPAHVSAMLASIPRLGLIGSRRQAVARAICEPDYLPAGPKVSSFYRNIVGDWNAVTIDAWMVKPFGLRAPAARQYTTFADAIRFVADEFGIPPAVCQAQLWGWYRRESGWRRHDPNPLQED